MRHQYESSPSARARSVFVATRYQGKPAVYDTVARVYYFGFRSEKAASERAHALNRGE